MERRGPRKTYGEHNHLWGLHITGTEVGAQPPVGSIGHGNPLGIIVVYQEQASPGVFVGAHLTYGKHRFQEHLWGALVTPGGGQPPVGSTGHRITWWQQSHLWGAQVSVGKIATVLGSPGEDMLTGICLLQRPRRVGTEGGINVTLREAPQHLLHRLFPELCFSLLASPVVPGPPQSRRN